MNTGTAPRRLRAPGGVAVCVAASLLLHAALAVLLWHWPLAPAPPIVTARRTIEVRLQAAPLPPASGAAGEATSPEVVAPARPGAGPGDRPADPPATAAVIESAVRPTPQELAAPTETPAVTAPATEGLIDADSRTAADTMPAEDRDPVAERALDEEYRQRLWTAIAAARPPGIHLAGEALVSFTLDPAGQLLSVEISRSSGNALLDKLALRCVRGAAPFPPPPPALSTQGLRFSIAFQFS